MQSSGFFIDIHVDKITAAVHNSVSDLLRADVDNEDPDNRITQFQCKLQRDH
jgi:hypothetical protein